MNTHYCKIGKVISYSDLELNSDFTLESKTEIEDSEIIYKDDLED